MGDKKTGIWEPGCGGYVGGKSALSHYKDGIFGTPRVTTWERGTNQEVLWESKAYHRGGYAYRLCKVKKGKIWKVNEKCFQKGHLKFTSLLGTNVSSNIYFQYILGNTTWRSKLCYLK